MNCFGVSSSRAWSWATLVLLTLAGLCGLWPAGVQTAAAETVRQDFVFEETYYPNFAMAVDGGCQLSEIFDINLAIQVAFLPNDGGSYDLYIIVDPYKVRHECDFFPSTGEIEASTMGYMPGPASAPELEVQGTLVTPDATWGVPASSTGNGYTVGWVARDVDAAGTYTLNLETRLLVWTYPAAKWISKSFTFQMVDPNVFTPGMGYLVLSGLLEAKSDWAVRNQVSTTHHAGTITVWSNSRSFLPADSVRLQMLWTRARRSDSATYGSPYTYSPDRLTDLQFDALGKQATFTYRQEGAPDTVRLTQSGLASNIGPPGTVCLPITARVRCSPSVLAVGDSLAAGLGFGFGAQFAQPSASTLAVGEVTPDRFVDYPLLEATSQDFCVTLNSAVLAPPAPDTLFSSSETVPVGEEFRISWDSVPGATDYCLYEDQEMIYAGSGTETVLIRTAPGDYAFNLAACNGAGCSDTSRPLVVHVDVALDADDPSKRPHSFALEQNYPNPFNPSTRIEFSIPAPSHVKLIVYNVLGARVRGLLDETLPGGFVSVLWDGRDERGQEVPSGVYFYSLQAGDRHHTRRMMLVR